MGNHQRILSGLPPEAIEFVQRLAHHMSLDSLPCEYCVGSDNSNRVLVTFPEGFDVPIRMEVADCGNTEYWATFLARVLTRRRNVMRGIPNEAA